MSAARGDLSLFLSRPSAFPGSQLSPLFVALSRSHIPASPLLLTESSAFLWGRCRRHSLNILLGGEIWLPGNYS